MGGGGAAEEEDEEHHHPLTPLLNSIVPVSLIFPIIITCDGHSIKFSNGLIPTPIIERVSSGAREKEEKNKMHM